MNLVNTKFNPPGHDDFYKLSVESQAYCNGNPYPYYGFTKWMTERHGPYPRCMPIPIAIVKKAALWLFGKPITINFNGDDAIEKDILRSWKLNKMNSKLLSLAIKGGTEGNVSLKFSYNELDDVKLKFQVLSSTTKVKYYYDPHDIDKLIMVRIQYPYFDAVDGQWWWYREEWTVDEEIHYYPIKIANVSGKTGNIFTFNGISRGDVQPNEEWTVSASIPNNFGVIPVFNIKNFDNGTCFGDGDLFGLTRIIDRINLVYHLLDGSNQLEISPIKAFIDLEPTEGDSIDSPTKPGGSLTLSSTETDDGVPKNGKIEILETNQKVKDAMFQYATELKNMLFDATGSVFPRQDEITNKGALTQSVVQQIYAPLIETVGEKRKSYGDNGICEFLTLVVRGLANLGVEPYRRFRTVDIGDEKLETKITWFAELTMSEDEKFAAFDRYDREIKAGYVKREDAIERINQLEEFHVTDDEIATLANESEVKEKEQTENVGHPSGNDPGGTENGQRSRQQVAGNRVKDAS